MQVMPLQSPQPFLLLFMDTLQTGRAESGGRYPAELGGRYPSRPPKMREVQLTVSSYQERLIGHAIVLMFDNVLVVVYPCKQGGEHLLNLCVLWHKR